MLLLKNRISEMQRELMLRLEEIDANKEEETKAVKQRYIQMFNEKAEELHSAREDIKKYQKEEKEKLTLITDLQDREEELQNLLGKTRAALEDEYKGKCEEVRLEVKKAEEKTKEVEKELEGAKWQQEQLQESYRTSVQSLARRLHEITSILREHQEEQEGERVKCLIVKEEEEEIFGLHIPTSDSNLQANSVSSEDSAVVIEKVKVIAEEERGSESEGLTSSSKGRKRSKARRRRNKHKN